jgi:hypothetical protein
VQWKLHSSPRPSVRLETGVTNVEQFAVWQPLLTIQDVSKKSYDLLRGGRKQKWIWATLVALASIQSYFVRGLLSALFLFTVLYVILIALAALYILIDHVIYCGIVWAQSLGRSLQSLARHHLALHARVPSLPKGRALDSVRN